MLFHHTLFSDLTVPLSSHPLPPYFYPSFFPSFCPPLSPISLTLLLLLVLRRVVTALLTLAWLPGFEPETLDDPYRCSPLPPSLSTSLLIVTLIGI